MDEDVSKRRYVDVLEFKNAKRLLANVTPLDSDQVNGLRDLYPGLPDDYLDLLKELGYGSYGGGDYSIYSGPSSPEFVYGNDIPEHLRRLLLIGDDCQGHCSAFDPARAYEFVEIDPISRAADPTNQSFEEFARNFFLVDRE